MVVGKQEQVSLRRRVETVRGAARNHGQVTVVETHRLILYL
jgi:hypothetical protein